MRIKAILGVALISALIFQSCSRMGITGTASGGESKTASISGSAIYPSGTPAAGATVRLRRSDYVAPPPGILAKATIFGAEALTDAHGSFEISGIDSGSYSIEVNDSGSAVLFTCTIAHDTSRLQADTLRPYAAVFGTVDTTGTSDKRLYVQVLGLERLAPVDSAGLFEFKDLPAGLFGLHIIAVTGTQTTLIQSDQVSAVSGDTVRVTMPGWSYSARLYLNTTASGAQVPGTVANFPVLIRLTSGNFTFAQAKSGGDDVRFTKSNGTPLPYEIERWDSAGGLAEIWVNVDTVFGNDDNHFIAMFWGNPAATSASNGAKAFDTADGFQGVWHMNDPVSGPVRDATINGYDGTVINAMAQTAAPAMVGLGRGFAQADSGYIMLAGTAQGKLNFEENGVYAISAWVYADTINNLNHAMVTKSDQQYNMELCSGDWEFAEYKSSKQWELCQSPATAKKWAFVVGIRNGSRQYLFVNGMCVDSIVKIPATTSSDRNTGYSVMFGRTDGFPQNGFPYYFHGVLDEIRMLNVAPDANWIKLCYMNQKLQDALVEFR
jgi:Domain of unknown function (DUF2341)/Concanavalin A-like lectin/glucanases superfamily